MIEKTHDYVMWIDADAFFCNDKIKIEDWILKSNEKDIIISRDPGYTFKQYTESDEPKLNSGVMIFKNNDNNIKLLNKILNDKIYEPNYNFRRSKNQYTGITGWDQAAIEHCYLHNIYNMKNNTWVCLDTNLNNNCNDVQEYINNGGFIIHLTNFMGKFRGKKINTISQFYKLQ